MRKPEPLSTGISKDARFYEDDQHTPTAVIVGYPDHQRGTPDLGGEEQPTNELPTRPNPDPFRLGGQ